jgi:shikimate kinase
MKIFLVGMPGAGKSTLGKQLGEKLMLPFLDLDKEIQKKEQRTVPDIFREDGEEYFRKTESEILHDISTKQHSFVLATGGGTPCFYNSMEFMKTQGTVIFMDVDVETIFPRVKNSSDRPLLALESEEELKQRLAALRAKRLSHYEKAHLIFSGSSLSADAVAYSLVLIKKENQQ